MNSIVLLSVIMAAAVVALCLTSGLRSRRTEELLRGRNILLDGALNNMTQGLNTFDSAGERALHRDVPSCGRQCEAGGDRA
jgi:hypothetical protein